MPVLSYNLQYTKHMQHPIKCNTARYIQKQGFKNIHQYLTLIVTYDGWASPDHLVEFTENVHKKLLMHWCHWLKASIQLVLNSQYETAWLLRIFVDMLIYAMHFLADTMVIWCNVHQTTFLTAKILHISLRRNQTGLQFIIITTELLMLLNKTRSK